MTLPTPINLTIDANEYIAGVAVTLVDRHHMLTLWRDTYLMVLSNEANPTDGTAQATAASAADNAVEQLNEFIDTLVEDADEADEEEPVVVPGRAS